MKTWDLHIPDYQVVLLNYTNLEDYLPENIYELSVLKTLPLKVQKDAIEAAILWEHGGIFMDADTLVTRDITPVLENLSQSEMILFSQHVAFIAARPGAHILRLWVEKAQKRLLQLKEQGTGETKSEWDFMGNSILAESMDDMVRSSGFGRFYIKHIQDHSVLERISRPVWSKRRGIFFRTIYKKYMKSLNRKAHGFIAEAVYFGSTRMPPQEMYRKFWFGDDVELSRAFVGTQRLIGLHHSWTPDWYKALSESAVLEHSCLLSRTLKFLTTSRDKS